MKLNRGLLIESLSESFFASKKQHYLKLALIFDLIFALLIFSSTAAIKSYN
tara:strand:+ start:641 stop:793 length:153 start_codon:yes stop_codon:yes gene_type:complete